MKIKILREIPVIKAEVQHLTVNSIHQTIPAPKGKESLKGRWVKGKTEPVRLLPGEFEVIEK